MTNHALQPSHSSMRCDIEDAAAPTMAGTRISARFPCLCRKLHATSLVGFTVASYTHSLRRHTVMPPCYWSAPGSQPA
eukprot:scaffold127310_cov57-Phaeocystis_antarctica.AAC.1